jgi:hypothetical protein
MDALHIAIAKPHVPRKSCVGCRWSKVKCIAEDCDSACKRCARLGLNCLFEESKRGQANKKRDIARLGPAVSALLRQSEESAGGQAIASSRTASPPDTTSDDSEINQGLRSSSEMMEGVVTSMQRSCNATARMLRSVTIPGRRMALNAMLARQQDSLATLQSWVCQDAERATTHHVSRQSGDQECTGDSHVTRAGPPLPPGSASMPDDYEQLATSNADLNDLLSFLDASPSPQMATGVGPLPPATEVPPATVPPATVPPTYVPATAAGGSAPPLLLPFVRALPMQRPPPMPPMGLTPMPPIPILHSGQPPLPASVFPASAPPSPPRDGAEDPKADATRLATSCLSRVRAARPCSRWRLVRKGRRSPCRPLLCSCMPSLSRL